MNTEKIINLNQLGYIISDDRTKLDYTYVHNKLLTTYWASNRTFETNQIAFDNSFVKLVLYKEQIVGFARLVTDYAVFAYVADVFIDEEHRKLGLAKWLVNELINDPQVALVRKFMLRTNDAQELYKQLGFNVSSNPEYNMERVSFT